MDDGRCGFCELQAMETASMTQQQCRYGMKEQFNCKKPQHLHYVWLAHESSMLFLDLGLLPPGGSTRSRRVPTPDIDPETRHAVRVADISRRQRSPTSKNFAKGSPRRAPRIDPPAPELASAFWVLVFLHVPEGFWWVKGMFFHSKEERTGCWACGMITRQKGSRQGWTKLFFLNFSHSCTKPSKTTSIPSTVPNAKSFPWSHVHMSQVYTKD